MKNRRGPKNPLGEIAGEISAIKKDWDQEIEVINREIDEGLISPERGENELADVDSEYIRRIQRAAIDIHLLGYEFTEDEQKIIAAIPDVNTLFKRVSFKKRKKSE